MNAAIVLWIAGIVVGHGYPFDKAYILNYALFLHGRFNLLFVDFRYFGESEGYACLWLGGRRRNHGTAQAVRESAAPLLLIHGEADSQIPLHMRGRSMPKPIRRQRNCGLCPALTMARLMRSKGHATRSGSEPSSSIICVGARLTVVLRAPSD